MKHKPLRSTADPRSILSHTFGYTNSAKTDIRKTFRRIRRQMKEAEEAAALLQNNSTIVPVENVVDFANVSLKQRVKR